MDPSNFDWKMDHCFWTVHTRAILNKMYYPAECVVRLPCELFDDVERSDFASALSLSEVHTISDIVTVLLLCQQLDHEWIDQEMAKQ